MRPVPAGRQRGQCCTPYSRLQEEIDNVETTAVTANNTANNAANAANTAVSTANSAMAGLTDGSVTKIGTSTLGSDTKPIKLVGGVPTIVTNDLVDTATAQTVGGDKTYTGQQIATGQRAYNAANTDDIATIGTLDAYTPMVRTTGNQTISGLKMFTSLNTSKTKNTSGSTKYFIFAKLPSNIILTGLRLNLILLSRSTNEAGLYTLAGDSQYNLTVDTTATSPANLKIVTDGTSYFIACEMTNNNLKSLMFISCFDTALRANPDIFTPYAVTTETDVMT